MTLFMEEFDYQEMMKQYPILFCQKEKSMMETCMCWGIECDVGWYKQLNELCSSLEQLNNDYKKYRIQIQAIQVKEKFGGLRFYYNVYFEKHWIEKSLLIPIEFLEKLLNKIDFQVKYDTIQSENEEQWQEISKEDFESRKELTIRNDFGWKFKEEDGKYYRNMCVYHPQKFVFYATKHKMLYKIKEYCSNLKHCTFFKPSKKRVDKANFLYHIAEKLIQECEEKCWDTCEHCGEENDYSKSKIITTSGWISRICKKCSQKIFENETKIFDEKHPDDKFHGIDRITLFKQGYNFLSFYHSNKSFKYEDNYYSSIPHAYFSLKFPDLRNIYDDLIHSQNSSELIEKISMLFDFSYDKKDYELIKKIVYAKFSDEYNNDIRQDLIDTGNKMLINMNGDCENVLGICYCEKCKLEKGENLYGKILMEVREELKKTKKSE